MDYDITLEPSYAPLEPIRIADAEELSDHPWFNRTLCAVNQSLVRLGVFEGEFHWHAHEAEDELFFVLTGQLEIELEGRESVVLGPHEGVMVPRGVRHRPKAPAGATVLMVENATIVPTGDPG
ncbi:MAG: cupin domain-containing protein [Acidobacteria bacterium]|nr:cupin domain-containing protein [Acidobacteriota bacterium]